MLLPLFVEQTTTSTKLTSTLSTLSTTLPTTMKTTENIDITATTEDEQITTDRVSNPITTITDGSMHYSKGISRAMIDEKENQSPLQSGTLCFSEYLRRLGNTFVIGHFKRIIQDIHCTYWMNMCSMSNVPVRRFSLIQ